MRFTSKIIVKQTVNQVWEFLSDPLTASTWDRSVAYVNLPENGFTGLGSVVETVSPSGMKQSFVITDFQSPHYFKFRLLKSKVFKKAELSFLIEGVEQGTKITHKISFSLYMKSAYLYPILLFSHQRALKKDLKYLREALEDKYKD